MAKARVNYYVGLLVAILILAQCEFSIFPDFMTRVASTKNLAEYVASNTTSFYLVTTNMSGTDYILLVKHYSSGHRGLVMLDQNMNIVFDQDSDGFGRACGALEGITSSAIICGVNLVYQGSGGEWSYQAGDPDNYEYRDRLLAADGLNYNYLWTEDGLEYSTLRRAWFTADNAAIIVLDADDPALYSFQLGSTAGRFFTLEAVRRYVIEAAGYHLAVFRDNAGIGVIFDNTEALFYNSAIGDSMLYNIQDYIVTNSSHITNSNNPYLLHTDGTMKRYEWHTTNWKDVDTEDGSQYRGYCITLARDYQYLFNTLSKTMSRVRFIWQGQDEYY